MAFSEKENQIIEWAKANGKSGAETQEAIFRFRSTGSPAIVSEAITPEPTLIEKAKDVGIGVAKGLGRSAVEAEKLTPTPIIRQATKAALDPDRTFFDVRRGEREAADEAFEATTPEQKIGKGVAFGIELLLPVKSTVSQKVGAKITEKIPSIRGKVAFDSLEETIKKLGIRAEDALNPIDEGVETVLRRTDAEKFNTYVDTARKANVEPKAATGLEVAGKKAEDALDIMQRKLNEFGRQKGVQLEKASVGNKNVGNIVVKFRQNLDSFSSTKTLDKTDIRIIKEISDEAKKLGNNPTAKEVDTFIDFVQDKVFTAKRSLSIDVTDGTTSAIRRASGELNNSLKDQLPEAYRNANQQFSDLIGLRNELNTKLGKEGERAGSLMKRIFSPSDARTKEMFQEVLDITNIDLVDEAVLARYTMQVFGDARQASLLEELVGGSGGIVSKALSATFDRLLGKFKGREAELRKALRLLEEGQ